MVKVRFFPIYFYALRGWATYSKVNNCILSSEIWPEYAIGIVQGYVIPFIQGQANNVTFQQVNARPHVVRDYFTWHSRMLMCYRGQRFHPIFHPLSTSDKMERRLRHLLNQPVTLAEMGPALIRIWNNIAQAFFNTIRSMRRRCQACINANGWHTRYWLC
jgi:hypothetical protein